MLRLDATTKIFQLSATASADVDVSGLSVTSAAATGFNEVTAATATTQTIAAAPAASTVKQVDYISIKNTGAGTNTVTVKKFNSSGSVTTQLAKATLAVDETLIYTHAGGWQTLDATGSKKVGTAGWVIAAGKIGTLSNSLTLAGTDGTTMTFPATSASIARTDVAQTFTGTTHNDFHVTGVNGLGSKGAIYLFSDAKTAGDAINFPMYLTNSADAVKAYASMRATITDPTAGSEDGTIAFNTIAAGVTGDRFAMVGNSGIAIPPGYKMWFDGTTATGDTYITESSANVLDLYAGGVNTLTLGATGSTFTGTVGIGTAPITTQMLRIGGTTSGGTTQQGLSVVFTVGSDCTATGAALGFGLTTAAAAFNLPNAVGVDIFNVTLGAGSSVSNQYGLQIADQTRATGTNAGVRLLVSSGTSKYNVLATGTAMNILAGNTRIGGGTDPTVALDVTGSIVASLDSGIASTKKLFLDGIALTGDTYIQESSANVLDLYAGAANTLRLTATGATVTGALAAGATNVTTLVGTDATDATSSTTAAFKTAGGLAVAKKLFVGTDVSIGARVLIGITTSNTLFGGALQYEGTSVDASFVRYANGVGGPGIYLSHSRGTSVGAHTILQDGDGIGSINFYGDNGTDVTYGAQIIAEVDGTPGASADMPSRLAFKTTPDGSGTPVSALRITSAQNLAMKATAKLYFDGVTGAGDTYITESSANVLDLYAGGVNTLKLSATAATITGTGTISGAFGCNTKAAQTAYASGGALAAYGAGANGFDSGANASALHAMVVSIRAALVANGIMS